MNEHEIKITIENNFPDFVVETIEGIHQGQDSYGVTINTDYIFRFPKRKNVSVNLEKEISADIRGKDVLVVDDILDSGRTLGWVKEHLRKFSPRSIKICVLLAKKGERVIDEKADYVGFRIPNVFVYGYGLDYRDRYRHLPYIARLAEDEVPPDLALE